MFGLGSFLRNSQKKSVGHDGLSESGAYKYQSMQANIEHALRSNEALYNNDELSGILKTLCARQLRRAVKNNEITKDEADHIAHKIKTELLA